MPLDGAALEPTDDRTWTLGGLADLTAPDGVYGLTLAADVAGITDRAGNPLADGAEETWEMDSRLLVLDFTSSAAISMACDPDDPTTVQFTSSDPPGGVLSVSLADLSRIFVILGAGDNTLTVDFSYGVPMPAGGLIFDGGPQATAAGDNLELVGAAGDDNVTLTPSQALMAGARRSSTATPSSSPSRWAKARTASSSAGRRCRSAGTTPSPTAPR